MTVKGLHPSLPYEVLWHPLSQDNAYPMNQLIFRKSDSSLVHVPIRDGSIKTDLERFGTEWRHWQLLTCISGDAQEAELQKVLGSTLAALKDAPIEPPVGGEFAGRMDAIISLPYLQAISKIAMHFVLARFDVSGFEEEFDEVKRFIYSGVGTPPAKIVEDIILPELIPEEARMRQWCHVLTAERNQDGFYSRSQFFVGPRLKPFVWRVYLGTDSANANSPEAKGFRFCYFDAADASGYVGEVIEMGLGPKMLAKL